MIWIPRRTSADSVLVLSVGKPPFCEATVITVKQFLWKIARIRKTLKRTDCRMAGTRAHLITLAVTILLLAYTATCRGDSMDNTRDSCDMASNIQSLLPCMTTLLGSSDPMEEDGPYGCCSALKLLAEQDNFIDCLCSRYDSKPDSCIEALHNIRC